MHKAPKKFDLERIESRKFFIFDMLKKVKSWKLKTNSPPQQQKETYCEDDKAK